jgi:hypothetical protein
MWGKCPEGWGVKNMPVDTKNIHSKKLPLKKCDDRNSPIARRRLQPASQLKAKLQLCTGLQSRQAVSIIKEHQVTVLIFTGRDFSLGVTERAKLELCFYVRRRLEPTPSGGGDVGWSLRRAGYDDIAHYKCLYS